MSEVWWEEARAAIAPCSQCDLTVPHAFEDPNAHSWDPNHLTVDPHDLLGLIERLRVCEEGHLA